MKVIDPSVILIYPMLRKDAENELRLVEYAGRNCYRTQDRITDDSYQGFLERLAARGHTSPLEFGRVVLEITAGRDVMAELTRHRMASFCIQSQRYVADDKTGEISFIKPLFYVPEDGDKLDAKRWCASRCWELSMRAAEDAYAYLRTDCSMSAEDARKVLPNSTATTIVMECNLRELLHILNLRTSPAAYPEMRQVMALLEDELRTSMPEVLKLKELLYPKDVN